MFVAYLTVSLVLLGGFLAYWSRDAVSGARANSARRSGEHWTERRTREAKARTARTGAYCLVGTAILLQGCSAFFFSS